MIKNASLRDSLLDSIGNFLYGEGFLKDDKTKLGILEIINLISDYHEEGSPLFPEILVTNNLDFFKTIPNKEIVIKETDLNVSEFKNAIKLCAPLAYDSWIIFIEVKNERIKYGITSAEMSETSPSIYNQTVGKLKVGGINDITIAYVRNIGHKTVELAGLNTSLMVSLTLDEPKAVATTEISSLCAAICSKIDENYLENAHTFFEKVIDDAIKDGHGNLIAVIDNDEKALKLLKETIISNGGIYLVEPIDFQSLIIDAETEKNNQTSINLKAHASVLKGMLNHDGITIISNAGKVVGFHILIADFTTPSDQVEGGARSKAFRSMINCKMFEFCFYKSQDGNIKIWEKA